MDVRAALEGRIRSEASWDLNYSDATRLRGVSAEEKCIVVLDLSDSQALAVARSVDGRQQIATIGVGETEAGKSCCNSCRWGCATFCRPSAIERS